MNDKFQFSNLTLGEGVPPHKGVTMTKPRQLFTKNISIHKVVRPCKGLDAYLVLQGQGSW